MNRFIVGSTWDRTNRNGINNNFDYLFNGVATMNNLSIKADATLMKADAVLTNAQNINQSNVNVQNQLDNIILENGTSEAEVVQARTDYLGTTFPLLKDRLNNIDKNISSRGANVINFGAVGDGVTDDTQAFKDALESGYKTVYAPNKKFLITDTLRVEENNMKVLFEGTLLFNVENETCLEISSNNNNIEILIDGNNTAKIGIKISGENNIIHDSTVKNIYSNNDLAVGIDVYNNNNNVVENCHVENVESVGNDFFSDNNGAARGIRVNGLHINNGMTLVKNNIITNIIGEEGDAIHLIAPVKDAMEVIVEGNKIHTFSRRGIKIQCSNTKIIHNVIENYTEHTSLIRAIDIQGVDNTVIMYNTLILEHVPCFGLAGTENKPVNNTVISNNTVKLLSALTAVYTTYVNDFDFTGNKIEGGGMNTFHRANKVKIVNNIFDSLLTDTTNFPISAMQSGDDVLIMNNTISNSLYHRPVRSSATNVKIIGNNFTDNIGGIELSSSGNGLVVNNVIKSSSVVSTSEVGYTVENNTLIPY